MLRAGICLLVISCLCSPVHAWTGYVYRVEDGDTIMVSREEKGQGEQSLVRLYGIDAPALNQPYAKEARAFLEQLLPKGTEVNIEETSVEDNGILTGLVQVKGSSVNYLLLIEGLAWVDRSTCKALFCRRWHIQEHRAREQEKGLWGLKLSTPPWQWGH